MTNPQPLLKYIASSIMCFQIGPIFLIFTNMQRLWKNTLFCENQNKHAYLFCTYIYPSATPQTNDISPRYESFVKAWEKMIRAWSPGLFTGSHYHTHLARISPSDNKQNSTSRSICWLYPDCNTSTCQCYYMEVI